MAGASQNLSIVMTLHDQAKSCGLIPPTKPQENGQGCSQVSFSAMALEIAICLRHFAGTPGHNIFVQAYCQRATSLPQAGLIPESLQKEGITFPLFSLGERQAMYGQRPP